MSAWLVAAVASGGAVGLLPAARPPASALRGRAGGRRPVLAALVPLGAIAAAAPPALAVLAVAGASVLLGAGALVRRRAARLRAARTSAALVDVCEQLAAELGAGQPPGRSLERAATDWTLLAPVAEAARIGADVPQALRQASLAPGAGGLRWVAAAWQIAHRTGQALAAAIDRVALDLRAEEATRRVVDGELASARATAKLVALLPLAALAMGSGVGGDPWRFLLATPVGLSCLSVGLALGWLGLWWIEAIARGVEAT